MEQYKDLFKAFFKEFKLELFTITGILIALAFMMITYNIGLTILFLTLAAELIRRMFFWK